MSKTTELTLEDAKKIDEQLSKNPAVNKSVKLGDILSKIGKKKTPPKNKKINK